MDWTAPATIIPGAPDMPRLLQSLDGRLGAWCYRAEDTVFFLPRDTLDPRQLQGRVAGWRVRLYSLLSRYVEDAAEYYRLPPRRVVEMGTQLSLEGARRRRVASPASAPAAAASGERARRAGN